MAIDLADIGKWTLRTFWNKDAPGVLPDLEMARNVLLTAVTFLLGWVLSMRGSSRRLKQRIVDELLMTQRELARRAYPDDYGGEWRQDDQRKTWMFTPLVSRIQFLAATLDDERRISKDAKTLMNLYVESVSDFIDEWTKTKTRFNGAVFETKFLRTHDVFIALARTLGPLESSRTRGLLPKRFQMRARFNLHSILAAPSASATSSTETNTKVPSRPKDLVPTE